MKCEAHSNEATAVCTYCGRAVCPQCERTTSSPRVACSEACADALAKADRAVNLVLAKHIQGARITAYYLYILGIIILAAGIYGYILYPRMRVVHPMAAACGIALIAFGVSFHRLAKRG
jgi:hypothetical protein